MRKVCSRSQHVLVWLGEDPGINEAVCWPSGNHYLGYSFLSPLSVVSQNPSEDYNFLSTVSMACAMLINQISEGEHMTAIEPFNSDIKNTFFRKPTGFLTNQINQFFI